MKVFIICAIMLALVVLGFYFSPKGWRTVVVNVLAFLPQPIQAIIATLQGYDWTAFFDKSEAAAVALFMMVLNIVMRSVTDTPMGKKL